MHIDHLLNLIRILPEPPIPARPRKYTINEHIKKDEKQSWRTHKDRIFPAFGNIANIRLVLSKIIRVESYSCEQVYVGKEHT